LEEKECHIAIVQETQSRFFKLFCRIYCMGFGPAYLEGTCLVRWRWHSPEDESLSCFLACI